MNCGHKRRRGDAPGGLAAAHRWRTHRGHAPGPAVLPSSVACMLLSCDPATRRMAKNSRRGCLNCEPPKSYWRRPAAWSSPWGLERGSARFGSPPPPRSCTHTRLDHQESKSSCERRAGVSFAGQPADIIFVPRCVAGLGDGNEGAQHLVGPARTENERLTAFSRSASEMRHSQRLLSSCSDFRNGAADSATVVTDGPTSRADVLHDTGPASRSLGALEPQRVKTLLFLWV